jgi:hypothetical protein
MIRPLQKVKNKKLGLGSLGVAETILIALGAKKRKKKLGFCPLGVAEPPPWCKDVTCCLEDCV